LRDDRGRFPSPDSGEIGAADGAAETPCVQHDVRFQLLDRIRDSRCVKFRAQIVRSNNVASDAGENAWGDSN